MSRIFLAGAAGVIGRRLTPLLIANGHSVWGSTRSPDKTELIRALGAHPVLVDVFDAVTLAAAILDAKPEIVIHQLTDLLRDSRPGEAVRGARPQRAHPRRRNSQPRRSGAKRWRASTDRAEHRLGLCARPRPYREDHPLDTNAEGDRGVSVRGVASLERQILTASPMEGVVLRYGRLYGPGSGTDTPPQSALRACRCRRLRGTACNRFGRAGRFQHRRSQ